MTTLNNTIKTTMTATQALNFLSEHAKKSRIYGKDRPAGGFGSPEFNGWLLAAMVQAYISRRQKDRTATGECPYQIAKVAVRRITRAFLKAEFAKAVKERVSDKDLRSMLAKGAKEVNDGDKTWLYESLDELQKARDKAHIVYQGLSMALFRHAGKNVFSLPTPDIYFKMVVSLDGLVDDEPSETAMYHRDEIDAYAAISQTGWDILRNELLKPLVKAFEMAEDTKILTAWFKIVEVTARGRTAYAEVVRETIYDGDNRFEVITQGWETNRIRFLTDVVNAPDAYAGDPRDYARQLANATKWAGRYELCDALYEEFKDIVRELYAAMPEPIDTDLLTLSTAAEGLWGNPITGKKGVIYYKETFNGMEAAIAGAKEARIHEQLKYHRERIHNVEDAAVVVAAKLGWVL
ncbi:hypothetical protein [Pasteurella testudinis]|uniref:hypothetical protein n=1 Tax=Pasteurella testudinis TaxID=761 RepID=UPI004058A837